MARPSAIIAINAERSDVWKYFMKTNSKTVTCSLCSKQLAFHGRTTNPSNINPSERHFSQEVGHTISKRSSLKAKNVDAILFLNSNYKYLSL